VPGRSFPVVEVFKGDGASGGVFGGSSSSGGGGSGAVRALRASHDYVSAAVAAVIDIHTEQPAGDVLVFLTGQDEIERGVSDCVERMRQRFADDPLLVNAMAQRDLIALPLYAALSPDKQVLVRSR
jgi:HrpA-like RNA helicase